MRSAIFGAGSQGDIQPCARLGGRLQRAGVPVLLHLRRETCYIACTAFTFQVGSVIEATNRETVRPGGLP